MSKDTVSGLITELDLINFENKVADYFNKAKIRFPIHLNSGNEKNLISVFKTIKESDWVFCSWRAHYQCILKGVPQDELFKAIVNGRSIALTFPKHRVFSSAIVTGIIPIAVGVALSLKKTGVTDQKVYCFMGEMTSESGSAYESIKYSINHKLPIHFIIENNEKSVCTGTRLVWGLNKFTFEGGDNSYITFYSYKSKYPHSGAGSRIQF